MIDKDAYLAALAALQDGEAINPVVREEFDTQGGFYVGYDMEGRTRYFSSKSLLPPKEESHG